MPTSRVSPLHNQPSRLETRVNPRSIAPNLSLERVWKFLQHSADATLKIPALPRFPHHDRRAVQARDLVLPRQAQQQRRASVVIGRLDGQWIGAFHGA